MIILLLFYFFRITQTGNIYTWDFRADYPNIGYFQTLSFGFMLESGLEKDCFLKIKIPFPINSRSNVNIFSEKNILIAIFKIIKADSDSYFIKNSIPLEKNKIYQMEIPVRRNISISGLYDSLEIVTLSSDKIDEAVFYDYNQNIGALFLSPSPKSLKKLSLDCEKEVNISKIIEIRAILDLGINDFLQNFDSNLIEFSFKKNSFILLNISKLKFSNNETQEIERIRYQDNKLRIRFQNFSFKGLFNFSVFMQTPNYKDDLGIFEIKILAPLDNVILASISKAPDILVNLPNIEKFQANYIFFPNSTDSHNFPFKLHLPKLDNPIIFPFTPIQFRFKISQNILSKIPLSIAFRFSKEVSIIMGSLSHNFPNFNEEKRAYCLKNINLKCNNLGNLIEGVDYYISFRIMLQNSIKESIIFVKPLILLKIGQKTRKLTESNSKYFLDFTYNEEYLDKRNLGFHGEDLSIINSNQIIGFSKTDINWNDMQATLTKNGNMSSSLGDISKTKEILFLLSSNKDQMASQNNKIYGVQFNIIFNNKVFNISKKEFSLGAKLYNSFFSTENTTCLQFGYCSDYSEGKITNKMIDLGNNLVKLTIECIPSQNDESGVCTNVLGRDLETKKFSSIGIRGINAITNRNILYAEQNYYDFLVYFEANYSTQYNLQSSSLLHSYVLDIPDEDIDFKASFVNYYSDAAAHIPYQNTNIGEFIPTFLRLTITTKIKYEAIFIFFDNKVNFTSFIKGKIIGCGIMGKYENCELQSIISDENIDIGNNYDNWNLLTYAMIVSNFNDSNSNEILIPLAGTTKLGANNHPQSIHFALMNSDNHTKQYQDMKISRIFRVFGSPFINDCRFLMVNYIGDRVNKPWNGYSDWNSLNSDNNCNSKYIGIDTETIASWSSGEKLENFKIITNFSKTCEIEINKKLGIWGSGFTVAIHEDINYDRFNTHMNDRNKNCIFTRYFYNKMTKFFIFCPFTDKTPNPLTFVHFCIPWFWAKYYVPKIFYSWSNEKGQLKIFKRQSMIENLNPSNCSVSSKIFVSLNIPTQKVFFQVRFEPELFWDELSSIAHIFIEKEFEYFPLGVSLFSSICWTEIEANCSVSTKNNSFIFEIMFFNSMKLMNIKKITIWYLIGHNGQSSSRNNYTLIISGKNNENNLMIYQKCNSVNGYEGISNNPLPAFHTKTQEYNPILNYFTTFSIEFRLLNDFIYSKDSVIISFSYFAQFNDTFLIDNPNCKFYDEERNINFAIKSFKKINNYDFNINFGEKNIDNFYFILKCYDKLNSYTNKNQINVKIFNSENKSIRYENDIVNLPLLKINTIQIMEAKTIFGCSKCNDIFMVKFRSSLNLSMNKFIFNLKFQYPIKANFSNDKISCYLDFLRVGCYINDERSLFINLNKDLTPSEHHTLIVSYVETLSINSEIIFTLSTINVENLKIIEFGNHFFPKIQNFKNQSIFLKSVKFGSKIVREKSTIFNLVFYIDEIFSNDIGEIYITFPQGFHNVLAGFKPLSNISCQFLDEISKLNYSVSCKFLFGRTFKIDFSKMYSNSKNFGILIYDIPTPEFTLADNSLKEYKLILKSSNQLFKSHYGSNMYEFPTFIIKDGEFTIFDPPQVEIYPNNFRNKIKFSTIDNKKSERDIKIVLSEKCSKHFEIFPMPIFLEMGTSNTYFYVFSKNETLPGKYVIDFIGEDSLPTLEVEVKRKHCNFTIEYDKEIITGQISKPIKFDHSNCYTKNSSIITFKDFNNSDFRLIGLKRMNFQFDKMHQCYYFAIQISKNYTRETLKVNFTYKNVDIFEEIELIFKILPLSSIKKDLASPEALTGQIIKNGKREYLKAMCSQDSYIFYAVSLSKSINSESLSSLMKVTLEIGSKISKIDRKDPSWRFHGFLFEKANNEAIIKLPFLKPYFEYYSIYYCMNQMGEKSQPEIFSFRSQGPIMNTILFEIILRIKPSFGNRIKILCLLAKILVVKKTIITDSYGNYCMDNRTLEGSQQSNNSVSETYSLKAYLLPQLSEIENEGEIFNENPINEVQTSTIHSSLLSNGVGNILEVQKRIGNTDYISVNATSQCFYRSKQCVIEFFHTNMNLPMSGFIYYILRNDENTTLPSKYDIYKGLENFLINNKIYIEASQKSVNTTINNLNDSMKYSIFYITSSDDPSINANFSDIISHKIKIVFKGSLINENLGLILGVSLGFGIPIIFIIILIFIKRKAKLKRFKKSDIKSEDLENHMFTTYDRLNDPFNKNKDNQNDKLLLEEFFDYITNNTELKIFNDIEETNDNVSDLNVIIHNEEKFLYQYLNGKTLKSNINTIDNELDYLESIKHKNILFPIAIYIKNSNSSIRFGLCFKYYPFSLSNIEYSRLSIVKKIKISKEILMTVNYFHIENIVYAGLKPYNIFLDDSFKCVSLRINTSAKKIDKYNSPEEISQQSIGDKKGDIWSYGVLIAELFYEEFPKVVSLLIENISNTENLESLRKNSLFGNNPIKLKNTDKIPKEIFDLISDCLHIIPEFRPTSTELLMKLNSDIQI